MVRGLRGIKGVKDIPPDQMPKWHVIESAARNLAHRYGFREIRIPIFEQTELYVRSIGGATDIVEKEMYTFPDRDGSSLTLRPEGTAGVVRAFIELSLAQHLTFRKLFYIGPMFRHERPQAGRFRQFHQFGVESIGSHSPMSDVEVITLLWRFFSTLQLSGLTLELNSLGQLEDRQRYKFTLVRFLEGIQSRLCENCVRRVTANPLRVLDCKVPTCQIATQEAPRILDYLSEDSKSHFDRVLKALQSLGIPYTLNPRLVRGLDYYCMTTFEVSCSTLGAQNAIGAGGRYDGLFEALGGKATPAVGFAVGLERVILALSDSVLPPSPPWVFVAAFGERGSSEGLRLLEALRAGGVPADTDHNSGTLKTLLRAADRLGAPLALILGDDEIARNQAIFRNMQTKEQEVLSLDNIVPTLSSRLSGAVE